jgi:hypothetical protein
MVMRTMKPKASTSNAQRPTPNVQRKARQDTLWAVIVVGKRSSWINPFTIAPQRAQAFERYLDLWPNRLDGERHFVEKTVRLAKVRVQEVQQEGRR